MSEENTEALQQIANRVNLGPHEFLITCDEDEEGRSGRWVVRRPTMRDELRIAVEYARLKTPENSADAVAIDVSYDNMAYMVATMNTVIKLRPEWFPKDVGDCFDAGLVSSLFERYCEWKNSFRRELSGEQGSDSGAAESA